MNRTVTQAKAPLKARLALGVFVAMGPVWSMTAVVMGQLGAAYHLKTRSADGMVDPSQLPETASWVLVANLIGFALLPIGMWLIFSSLRGLRKLDAAGQSAI